jgi:hypothetical protein
MADEITVSKEGRSGLIGAMEGMTLTRTSMGQYEPDPISRPQIVSPDLPEDWGGRPKGSSRRAIRMQAEWDERQKSLIEQSRVMQQMDLDQKKYEIQARDQQLQEDDWYFNRGLKEAEQKLEAQQKMESRMFMTELNKLDPRSSDYRQSVADLRDKYYMANLDPRLEKIVGEYDKVHDLHVTTQSQKQANDEAMRKNMQGVAKIAEESGRPLTDFVQTNPVTGRDVINYEELGRAEAAISQQRQRQEEPLIGGKTQKEIDKLITTVGAEIAEVEAMGDPEGKLDGLKAKKEYYEGLKVKDNKEVANTAQSQYIPVAEREVGKTYPTPQGELKWTGTGWVKP